MARIFIDGFESGDLSLWDEGAPVNLVQTAGAQLTGAYCLSVMGLDTQIAKTLPTRQEYYFAFTCIPESQSGTALCTIMGGEVPICTLTRKGTSYGELEIRLGDDLAAVSATSLNYLGLSIISKCYVVLHVVIHGTTGSVTATVNGRTAVSVTDVDTTYSGTVTGITKFILGSVATTGRFPGNIDDVVIDDSVAPIRPRIFALKPTQDGTYNDFEPSIGVLNYICVDDIPGTEIDFVMSGTPDAKDSYVVNDIPAIYSDVRCVQISSAAWYEGNSPTKHLELFLKTGTTEVFSDTKALNVYPQTFSSMFEINPDTLALYTVEEVNAMEIGIKALV